MFFQDAKSIELPRPRTRENFVDETLPIVRRRIGEAIDALRDVVGCGVPTPSQAPCPLKVRFHRDVWPVVVPMRLPLTKKLQRSVDVHTEFDELSLRFAVILEVAPTSSGGLFEIVIGEDGGAVDDERGPRKVQREPARVETPLLGELCAPQPGAKHAGVETEVATFSASPSDFNGLVLELLDSTGQANTIARITHAIASIGRDSGSPTDGPDIPIKADGTTSRVQLLVRRAGDATDRVEIRNIGRNAIFLNDAPVQPDHAVAELGTWQGASIGDRITIGRRVPIHLRIGQHTDNGAIIDSNAVFTSPS